MNRNLKVATVATLAILLCLTMRAPYVVHAQKYEYIWEWEGKTDQSYDTRASRKDYEPVPEDPFPIGEVVTAAKITILSEMVSIMRDEFAEKGITVTVTKIEPEAWVETKLTVTATPGPQWTTFSYLWQHWLHMKGRIFFSTDKPLTSPTLAIDPGTIVMLVYVLQKLLIPLAVVIALIIVAVAVAEWVKSWGVTKMRIYNPEKGEWEEWIWGPGTQWESLVMMIVFAIAAAFLGYTFINVWAVKSKHKRK